MKKKIYLLIFISAFCVSCSSISNIAASSKSKTPIEAEKQEVIIQNAVIDYGMKYLNTPYRYGGNTDRGFDCSGFTSYVYKNFGYSLGRSSRDQAEQFPGVAKKDLTRGDLVFFEGRSRNGRVGHVGIVTESKGNGEFEFIHATVNNGVIVSKSSEPYYANRYLKAGRVIDQKYPVATTSSTTLTATTAPSTTTAPTVTTTTSKSNISNSKETISENKYISDARYHTVKRGESLSVISRKYDVPITTLMHLNNLKSKRIKSGQRLMVAEAVENPNLKFVASVDNKHITSENVDVKSDKIIEAPIVVMEDTKPEVIDNKATELIETSIAETQIVVKENTKAEVVENEVTEVVETSIIKPSNTPKPTKQTVAKTYHKVVAGESLFSIAQKYNISVNELKRLNGITSNRVLAGQRLKVPTGEAQSTVAIENTKREAVENDVPEQTETSIKTPNKSEPTKQLYSKTHRVAAGESLSSIARKYNISVNELKRLNGITSNKILVGQRLKVPAGEVQATVAIENTKREAVENDVPEMTETSIVTPNKSEPTKQPEIKTHRVVAGESLYSIAEKYNISVDELKSLNGIRTNKILVGQRLKVSKGETSQNVSQKNPTATKSNQTTTHRVKPGETLYAIAKKYKCTVSQIKKWNPGLSDKIKVGDKIKIINER